MQSLFTFRCIDRERLRPRIPGAPHVGKGGRKAYDLHVMYQHRYLSGLTCMPPSLHSRESY
jgi:hypothetical protein